MNSQLADMQVLNEPTDVASAGSTAKKSLHKIEKLRFKSEFDYIRLRGEKQVGKGMLAVIAPSPDGLRRCGVICGKKYSNLAVDRNRARRLLWESFRLLKSEMAVCHLVLIPRCRMASWKRQETTRELAGLLARQGVLPAAFAASPPEC